MATCDAYIKLAVYLLAFLFIWEMVYIGSWRFKPSNTTAYTHTQRSLDHKHLLADDGQMLLDGWHIHKPDEEPQWIEVNQMEARSHFFGSQTISAYFLRNLNYFFIQAGEWEIQIVAPMEVANQCVTNVKFFNRKIGPKESGGQYETKKCPMLVQHTDMTAFQSLGVIVNDDALKVQILPLV